MWSTVASWAVLIAVAVAATSYYHPDLFKKYLPANTVQPPTKPSHTIPTKRRNKKPAIPRSNSEEKGVSTPTSSNEAPLSKRRKVVSSPVDQTVKATSTNGATTTLPRDESGSMKDREFAQQLFKAQQGTKMENKQSGKKDKQNQKVVRAEQDVGESANISTDTASNADDDVSPAVTPSSGANSTAPTSRTGDISDMLEAPAAKPTTLRLTNVEQNKPKANSFQKVESKKAKKPSRKQEEEKAMKAEADRLYEQKKQEQMRQARMAEGSSKQTKANTFTSNQNAWKTPEVPKPRPQQTTLLDTFNSSDKTKAGNESAVSTQPMSELTNGTEHSVSAVKEEQGQGKTEALAASAREARPELNQRPSWADDMIEEEKQNEWERQLTTPQQEDVWETVTTKKGKKNKKKDTDTGSEASFTQVRQTSRPKDVQTNGSVRPQSTNRFASVEGDTWEA